MTVLFESDNFRIEHARFYKIAGFLFVLPKEPAQILADLSSQAITELGPVLNLATNVLQMVVQPANIYISKFGESGGDLHFHIFPRTQELTDLYLEEYGADYPIDGPQLMSWANQTFIDSNEHGDIPNTIQALTAAFQRET